MMSSDSQQKRTFDAVIIGGGPAGSTAAAVLAAAGRRVAVIEKEKFPRYSVGESLLPYCYFPLERIGMIEKLRASSFIKKYSVQFATEDGRISQPFYFHQHFDSPAAQTWQVMRGEFDQMLLDNAREKGAEVFEETAARKLLREDDRVVGVVAERASEQMELRAPVTIDCSGRDAFSAVRNEWRTADPLLNKIALWTYYKGAKRDSGYDEGATTVAYLPEKGWFWYIPLPNDLVSVGIVGEAPYLYRDGKDLDRIFKREIGANLWIKDHLLQGTRVEDYRVTGEFSYRSRHCAEDGLVLAGDAFAFLDPVFSSGVFLALRSGEMVGEAVDAALTAGDCSAERFGSYSQDFRAGLEAMRKLVYAFYDASFSFGRFLKKHPERRHDLTDCLIGNLHRDFDGLFDGIAEFAEVPKPLAYGEPLSNALESAR